MMAIPLDDDPVGVRLVRRGDPDTWSAVTVSPTKEGSWIPAGDQITLESPTLTQLAQAVFDLAERNITGRIAYWVTVREALGLPPH